MSEQENINGYLVSKEKMPEIIFFGLRATVTKDGLKEQYGKAIPRMIQYVTGEKKLTWDQIGAISSLHFVFSDEKIDFVVGFPLKKEIADLLKEEDGMTKHVIPQGSYVQCVSLGPYDRLPQAWPAAFEFIKKHGLEKDDCFMGYESYINDPSSVPQDKLQTNVYVRVTDKRKRDEKVPTGNGGFCHMDIYYQDKDRVKKFYGNLLDWTFTDCDIPNYFFFKSPSGIDGGFEMKEIAKVPSNMAYLQVESIDLDLYKRVEQLGGKIVGDQTIFPQMGGYVPFTDSEGNNFSFWSGKVVAIEGYRSK
jgi:predicted enzyme related to lactoylglutathione lyase